MRSTPRSSLLNKALSQVMSAPVVLMVLALGALAFVWRLPPVPDGPRYAAAGAETPQRGGTFVFHHESDVRGFDPHVSYDEISNMGLKLLFEGLIDYDPQTLELIPRLAEAVPQASADGRSYRFRLRRGLRFADSPIFEGGEGREITGHDVVWSLEHMLHPETGSPGVTFFALVEGLESFRSGHTAHVSGIQLIDRYTVEIRLSRPDQTFLNAMAMVFAYPVAREAYARYGQEVARHPVGTGAYLLESWEPGVRVTFRRNPNYFVPGQPYVDRMIYELNLDRRAAVMRFRNGELDHIHRQTPADYLDLMEAPGWAPYRVQESKTNIWGVTMNCEMAPFDNRHVRRAVAFAINGQRWRRARANRLILSGQPIPRNLPGFDPELPGIHHHDLDIAREEMRLAGHPDGLADEVEVWLGEGDTSRSYGELIQADLREIGIRIRIKQVAFPTYLAETGKPGQAQMLLGGWSMDYPDPSNFLDILFHSDSIHERDSENRAFYRNPEVDRLLDEARVDQDREHRLQLYRQASAIIVDDAPWAFVFSDVAMEAWQPYVRGYRPNAVWSNFYRDVWLDLPRRRIASGPMAPRLNALAAALPGLSGALPAFFGNMLTLRETR